MSRSKYFFLTIYGIVEDCSGAFDTAGTANWASNIPKFNIKGFFLRGSLFVVLNL